MAVPGSRILKGFGILYLPTSLKIVVCPKTFTIKVNGGENIVSMARSLCRSTEEKQGTKSQFGQKRGFL
jgi:hypothetical protein